LRTQTRTALAALRVLLAQPAAPPAELKPQCDGCSLRTVCLPEAAAARAVALFSPRDYP
jgi:CRISPR/Cas system-associated exonuclease Cas4 (RecB family)